MAFQEVTAGTTNIMTPEMIDKPFEVFFVGSEKRDTQYGEQTIHKFVSKKGAVKTVYGSGDLNFKLKEIPVGVLVRITYKGKMQVKTKRFGEKEIHVCEVLYDPEQKLSLDELRRYAVSSNAAAMASYEEDDDFAEPTTPHPKAAKKRMGEDDLPF